MCNKHLKYENVFNFENITACTCFYVAWFNYIIRKVATGTVKVCVPEISSAIFSCQM